MTERKRNQKQAAFEVQTFSVPYALDEIIDNISIRTKGNESKATKEEIIKQAFQFHSQGNIQEAAKHYQSFIDQGFSDHRVFSHYGIILKSLGKLEDAEVSYRKAIEINPNFAQAHYNLGNILKDLGKLQEAETSTRKAIQLKPDFANAHLNLGSILKDLGKSQEAFENYLKVVEINPKLYNIYPSITRFLKESDLSLLNRSKLKKILYLLLEKDDLPHKELFNAFNFSYRNEIITNLVKLDSDFSRIELIINDKLIIKALKKLTFEDLQLEELLTKIRATICDHISKNTKNITKSELEFIIALGVQCFLNEYIYSLNKEENESVSRIINRCRNGELNETNIAILSCYFPLYKLLDQIPSLKSFNSSNQNFKELIKLQISEPKIEIQLSKSIKKVGPITDNISRKVKSQYEKNPYPRWQSGNLLRKNKITITQAINNEIRPNCISHNPGESKLKVLVAGCGTGQHLLGTQRYSNAKITGIDLCSASLSYAQRKINELSINNIELIQMDILEVKLLDEQFDIIESSGVLHHMDDPNKGLKSLLGILKPNGFLNLGLYSESARKVIKKARDYIKKHEVESNEKDIRSFRQKIISGELIDLNSLKKLADFYSLSECRDLCFHVQEHRFTIKQIQKTLSLNKLKFLGFILPPQIKSLYKNYFPEDKTQTNLKNWERFEEKHPNTFAGTYQFWIYKTEI